MLNKVEFYELADIEQRPEIDGSISFGKDANGLGRMYVRFSTDDALIGESVDNIRVYKTLIGGSGCSAPKGHLNLVFGEGAVAGSKCDIALIGGKTKEFDTPKYNAAIGYSANIEGGTYGVALNGGKITGGEYRFAANLAHADSDCMVALGKYNTSDYLFEVGNGTSASSPSNAMSVDEDGNMIIAGTLTIAGHTIDGSFWTGGSY